MSAAALAEYMIFKADQQEKVLHDSRFASPPVVIPHSTAMNAIRSYCSDSHRSRGTLNNVKADLNVRAADLSIRPKAREEALRCLETIELFELAENAFGLGHLRLELANKFALLDINGLSLSVQPDLIVRSMRGDEARAGGILFRPQKAPDPDACRLEETKRARGEHRREMGRYLLVMLQMAFEQRGEHLGPFHRDSSFVADIRMRERIPFPSEDYSARVRAIMAAGKQITRQWGGIEPRNSVLAKD